ncbi:MAG TPA: 2-C-methyl-D-erythritol 4-phosphate cytidylyltransferase [Gemmatimonadales bacterium]|nr:2-C-methyl-D-erythritol 4-phosphate cytidylyltransferase [Gemmatimonadales bacterium]
MPRDVGVVLVAAGQGTRLGGPVPKQYRELDGRPVLLWSLETFLALDDVAQVVVVLPPADAALPPSWLGTGRNRVSLVGGGAERHDSVERGTAALSSDCITVLVHDAARPLVDRVTIETVIAVARQGEGAVPALPMGDTVKEAGAGNPPSIVRTVAREGLWRAQTPQGFPRRMLVAAQARARADRLAPTDDAALVEHNDGIVRLVPGTTENFKLTTEADFALAEAIVARRKSRDR